VKKDGRFEADVRDEEELDLGYDASIRLMFSLITQAIFSELPVFTSTPRNETASSTA
jgi:hypothetical protein